MATLVLNASDCDSIELDILKNVQFNSLFKIDVSSNLEENRIFITGQKTEILTPIRALMKSNYFNIGRVKHFLENIYSCQIELREHLLRESQIHFSPDHIYYDEQMQKYVFLYKPTKESVSSDLERYLIQDLLIQAKALETLEHLSSESYCLVNLLNNLDNCGQKKPFLNFFPMKNKKIKAHEAKPQSAIKNQTISLTPKASLISKENHNEILNLPFAVNSVGRGSHCNVYINSPTLSSEHAVISLIQGKYYVKDKQSKNGTFVNNMKIENNTALTSGNIIKFGEKEFIFIL